MGGWTNTRIDVPRAGTVPANRQTRIAGIAFAGSQGIAKVEVSVDERERVIGKLLQLF